MWQKNIIKNICPVPESWALHFLPHFSFFTGLVAEAEQIALPFQEDFQGDNKMKKGYPFEAGQLNSIEQPISQAIFINRTKD